HPGDRLRVRAGRRDPLLSLAQAARGDQLHRLGDLLRRPGGPDPATQDAYLTGHGYRFGGTSRVTLSRLSAPLAIASASASLIRISSPLARKFRLNSVIAAVSDSTVSSGRSLVSSSRVTRSPWWMRRFSRNSASKRRTSPTGTSSSWPVVPAH